MDYDNLQDIKLKGSTIPELIINQQGFSSHCILYCPRNPHLAQGHFAQHIAALFGGRSKQLSKAELPGFQDSALATETMVKR